MRKTGAADELDPTFARTEERLGTLNRRQQRSLLRAVQKLSPSELIDLARSDLVNIGRVRVSANPIGDAVAAALVRLIAAGWDFNLGKNVQVSGGDSPKGQPDAGVTLPSPMPEPTSGPGSGDTGWLGLIEKVVAGATRAAAQQTANKLAGALGLETGDPITLRFGRQDDRTFTPAVPSPDDLLQWGLPYQPAAGIDTKGNQNPFNFGTDPVTAWLWEEVNRELRRNKDRSAATDPAVPSDKGGPVPAEYEDLIDVAILDKVLNATLNAAKATPDAPGEGPVPQDAIDAVGATNRGSSDKSGQSGDPTDTDRDNQSAAGKGPPTGDLAPFASPEEDDPEESFAPDDLTGGYRGRGGLPPEVAAALNRRGPGLASDNPLDDAPSFGRLPPGVRDPRAPASYDPEGNRGSGSRSGRNLPPGVRWPGGPAGTPNPEGGGPLGPAARAALQQRIGSLLAGRFANRATLQRDITSNIHGSATATGLSSIRAVVLASLLAQIRGLGR